MAGYSEDLLQLAQSAVSPIPDGATFHEKLNRMCGDQIAIAPQIKDGLITGIDWRVEGCVIVKASAAYLAQRLLHKNIPEILQFISAFKLSFSDASSDLRSGPLAAVYALPARYKCALLPYEALEDFLRNRH